MVILKNYDNIINMDYCELYAKNKLSNYIEKDYKNNSIAHAYLLNGQDEILLKYFAQCVAKHILCGHNENCNCAICNKIDKNIFSDVQIYPKGNNGTLVVEDINTIVEDSFVYPLEGDKKIFILNNFDKCTIQAQNKLLKTLEEPNNYVVFILTTTILSAVLPTIISRTKVLDIAPLHKEDVEMFLNANFSLDKEKLQDIANSSSGTITKALQIVNDKDFMDIRNLLIDVLKNMKNSSEVLYYSSKLLKYKGKIDEILDELLVLIRDCILLKSGYSNNVFNQILIKEIDKIHYSIQMLTLIEKEILESNNKLKFNCNNNAVIDSLLLKMLEVKFLCK